MAHGTNKANAGRKTTLHRVWAADDDRVTTAVGT